MRVDGKPGRVLGIRDVVGLVDGWLSAIGPERIDVVTTTRSRVSLHPRDLSESEQIARELGCVSPLDHRTTVPGYTLWSGTRDGIEVQVRAALRRPVGTIGPRCYAPDCDGIAELGEAYCWQHVGSDDWVERLRRGER
ncbi:hypothetical protein [Myceligenerans pegani]|uniref:Uncharacterized protein n=1 Tax=Myceligenerans pegani TaxID=2776917 RepID=A0ABR9MXQ1_9MICO|nr:hypothetical protein [Myceligenerans sp. TRM 65318]MBE1876166.1 hypothetical protein [Myceligenerans sp. TRM 65318]MBE3018437.1 hypothetical protein [Myceligenerans sp. TRM 65318]